MSKNRKVCFHETNRVKSHINSFLEAELNPFRNCLFLILEILERQNPKLIGLKIKSIETRVCVDSICPKIVKCSNVDWFCFSNLIQFIINKD